MQSAFGALAFVLFLHVVHSQKNAYVHHLIEMPGNTIQLAGHLVAQGRCDFQVMAANRQVHKKTPSPKWIWLKTLPNASKLAADEGHFLVITMPPPS